MSDRDEHNEEDGAPLDLFWLGNIDEGNRVDADYLDEVREILGSKQMIVFVTELFSLLRSLNSPFCF